MFFAHQKSIETAANELYRTDKNLAINFLSHYSSTQADYVHKE
jgi:hypothetical protein